MPDYSNSRIYKIVDNTNGNIYIGSTTQTLSRRLAKHRSEYQCFLENKNKNKITSFQIIQNSNYEIILLENMNCATKEQLHARERFYIENNVCVNKNIPTRTKKEYMKDYDEEHKQYNKEHKAKYYEKNKECFKEKSNLYYETNKEQCKERVKQYQEQHKQEINKKLSVKILCECGKSCSKRNISTHRKTPFHQQFLSTYTYTDRPTSLPPEVDSL